MKNLFILLFQKKATDADTAATGQLRTQCAQALLTISKNNTHAQQVIKNVPGQLELAVLKTSNCKLLVATVGGRGRQFHVRAKVYYDTI